MSDPIEEAWNYLAETLPESVTPEMVCNAILNQMEHGKTPGERLFAARMVLWMVMGPPMPIDQLDGDD
jgi:hypothetical protein